MENSIDTYFDTFFGTKETAHFLVDFPLMHIVKANQSALNLYDFESVSEVLNKSYLKICKCGEEKYSEADILNISKDALNNKNISFESKIHTFKDKEFYAKIKINSFLINGKNYFIVDIIDNKKEEKNKIELEQTKETYKAIYNSLPNGVITHIDGVIYSCNNTFLEHINLAKKNIYGTKFFELFHEEDHDKILKQINNPKKGSVIIVSGFSKSDVWHKFTLESFSEKYFDKEVIVSIISDYQVQENLAKEQLRANLASEANVLLEKEIEKHKETRRKLEASQEISKSVFNSSIDNIISTDLDNNILEVSPSACNTFGYEMDELFGKKSIDLYADINEFNEIENHLRTEGYYIGEILNKRKDGSVFTSFLSCAALKNNKGDKIGFMGISRDITDIKKAEEELIESEKKYRDLFVNLSDAVIVVDKDNYIKELNNAAYKLLEIEDLTSYNLLDFVHEEDKSYVLKRSKEFRKKGSIVNVEFKIKTQKGNIRIVNLSSSAIYDGSSFIGSRDIIRDITSQKEAEQNLTKSIKEKEVLLKEVHHRVKNNLQVISSILNLQSSYVKDVNTLNILRESQNRVKSMSFIHESLYRSKDFSEVNFSDYINNLVNNILHSFDLSTNAVQLNTDLGAVNLNLDQAIPAGLIINELLTNAMKYAYKNIEHPELKIEIHQNNSIIDIVVEDNGVGLPKGFKIEESDSLGLQLVHTLIEQIDGTLSVKNENGTKYLITFEKVN